MGVLVFVDTKDNKPVKSAPEAVFYGSKIAQEMGGDTTVVTFGECDEAALAALGNYGASKVLYANGVSDFDGQKLSGIVEKAVEETGAKVVVFSHDYTGKSLAPLAAAKMKAGLVAGAVDYPSNYTPITVKKAVFSGKAFAEFEIKTDKAVIALLPNSVQAESGSDQATVEAFNPDVTDGRITVKEVKTKGGDGISLTEADLVVSAGRGLKGPENWGMIEELANELGAATACSRPVSDIGWRPHHEHVGQTGIAIRPNLYIAIGISGAIQHLAGVNGSKVIVVINKDPEAPFFKAADYGIVGDAFEVVPKLIDAVKNFKAA